MSSKGLGLTLGVTDRISGKINKITKSFTPLRRALSRTSGKFKVLQRNSEGLRKSLGKMGGKMKSIGGAMALGLTAPILGFGAAVIKTSANFQDAMNKVEALTGSTGKAMDMLTKKAMHLGKTTKFSATESADAMAFLGQKGWDAAQIMKGIPGILDLAAASGSDLATAADIASNIMGGFGLAAGEAGRVADVLALTTAKSGTNLIQLGEAFKKAAPISRLYGATLEQTAAMIGKLGDAGIKGSLATTTLSNMFSRMASPAGKAKKILQALGVSAKDTATGGLRPMRDVLKDLVKSMDDKKLDKGGKLGVLKEVFGKNAFAGAGVLLGVIKKIDPKTGKLTDSVEELEKLLLKADGTSKAMAKTLEKGLGGSFRLLKSATEGMLLSFGFKGGLAGVTQTLVEHFTTLINWISGFSSATLITISVVAGLVAVIGPLVFAFGIFLTMLPSMIVGFNLLQAGLAGATFFGIGLNASLLPVIATIGLLAIAAGSIIANWTPIKEFFSDLFTSPLQQLRDMVDFVRSFTGAGSLFGTDTDAVDEQLKKQGFKLSDGKAKGPDLGAKKLTQKSNDYKIRQQKAQIDVNFANQPAGTAISTSDKDNILDVSGTGLMGAF